MSEYTVDEPLPPRRVRSVGRVMAEREAKARGRLVTAALAAWKDLRVAECEARAAARLPPPPLHSLHSLHSLQPFQPFQSVSRSASASDAAPRAPLLEDYYDSEVRRAAARVSRALARREKAAELQRERAIDAAAELRERLAEETAQRQKGERDARRLAERARAAEAEMAARESAFAIEKAEWREAERKRGGEMDELRRALRDERQHVEDLEEEISKHVALTTAMRAEIAALQEEGAALRAELHEAHAARRSAENAQHNRTNSKDNAADVHEVAVSALAKRFAKQEGDVQTIRHVVDVSLEEKKELDAWGSAAATDDLVLTPYRLAANDETSSAAVSKRLPLMSPSTSVLHPQPTAPLSSAIASSAVAFSPVVQSLDSDRYSVPYVEVTSVIRSGSAAPLSSRVSSALSMPSGSNAEVWHFPAVNEALRVLFYARDYAVRRLSERCNARATTPETPLCGGTERCIIAECVASLTAAIAEADAMCSHVSGIHNRGHFQSNKRSDGEIEEELRQHQSVLARVQQELRNEEVLHCADVMANVHSASAILAQDAAISALMGTLSERLSATQDALAGAHSQPHDPTNGKSRPTSTTRSRSATHPHRARACGKSNGHSFAKNVGLSARSASGLSPPLRHTFGAVGGRLKVSRGGTRLRRLLLPFVMDITTCSALGALDHRSALAATETGALPQTLFAFSVRVGMRCEGVLVGLADKYMPLEGFDHAQNSRKYGGCYYLHLGRSSLFCPAQGIIDMPYDAFRRASSSGEMAVQAGEKITCVLDTNSRTIRFLRDDADCGVAFTHVNITRTLFPAVETNSRGCIIDLV